MKIIAVTNIKGGVGKTTTAVNLSYLSAASGRRTLLWDLDAQGGATYLLGIDASEHESASVKKLLAGKSEVPEQIVGTRYAGLDLRRAPLPALSPNGAATPIYAALWAEISARMWPSFPGCTEVGRRNTLAT